MTYQQTSLLLSALIFTLYCAYCLQRFGLTRSISATFYEFKGNLRYLYTAYMWLFSIPMVIAGETGLLFAAMAGIAFTGTAADVKRSEATERIHVGGTIASITAGLLSVWLDFGMLWLAITGAVGCLAMWVSQFRNHTYWIEVWAYAVVWIAIWIKIC